MPASLTIVAGKDDYLVDREARARLAALTKQAGAEADVEVVDAFLRRVDDAVVIEQRIRSALGSMGLFGSAKIVWIQSLNWLELPKAQSASAQVAEVLEERLVPMLVAPPEGVQVLVSLIPVNRTRSEFKQLKAAAGEMVDIPDLDGAGQVDLVRRTLAESRVKLGHGAAEALVGRVSGSIRVLLGECEKLAVHAGPGGQVSREDVLRLVPTYGEGEFFEPVDALLAGDLAWTLEALDRFFFNVDSPRPLLGAVQGRLRLLIQLRALADAGVVRLDRSGVTPREMESAAARYAPLHRDAKSKYNPFTQNAWYIGTKIAPDAARFGLRELVDLQLDLAKVYASPDERSAYRDACVRFLAGRAAR